VTRTTGETIVYEQGLIRMNIDCASQPPFFRSVKRISIKKGTEDKQQASALCQGQQCKKEMIKTCKKKRAEARFPTAFR